MSKKMKVAIIGSGNIGTDLMIKTLRSPYLECALLAGRNLNSLGMKRAASLGVYISDKSIDEIKDNPDCCDLVFDATSALDHQRHWLVLRALGKAVIDMTPSMIGNIIIPSVNIDDVSKYDNVNMISCGGQASIPLAYAISTIQKNIEYIEVVSRIASKSAGPGTRINIDEYVDNTENGLKFFTGCDNVKAVLVINPAEPCIDMQTTISLKINNPDMRAVTNVVNRMVNKIRETYVSGYELIVPPVFESNRVVMIVRIRGLGDYLPPYAGNLDIINCAAIAVAERYAKLKYA